MSDFKIQLIPEWKQSWRLYSIWAMVLMGMLPEIYNEVVASGLIEGTEIDHVFSKVAKLAALAGVVVRLIKQAQLQVDAIKDAEDAAS